MGKVTFALIVLACSLYSETSFGMNIAVYGDSTSEGWQLKQGVGRITENNVPALLQQNLRKAMSKPVIVKNKAVGGTQASQLFMGLDGKNKPWRNEMASSDVDVVVINFALNDSFYFEKPKDGLASETPEAFRSIINEMVLIAKSFGKTVVIAQPNPTCEPLRSKSLAQYVEALNSVAQEQKVTIVRHFDEISKQPDWRDKLSDCLHPTDEMYEDKANREYQALLPIIRDLERAQIGTQ
jgi:lysophospholipase L1-like esterase